MSKAIYKYRNVSILALLVLLFVGCQQATSSSSAASDSVVGTWTSSIAGSLTFAANGSGSWTASGSTLPTTWTKSGSTYTVVVTGISATWTGTISGSSFSATYYYGSTTIGPYTFTKS